MDSTDKTVVAHLAGQAVSHGLAHKLSQGLNAFWQLVVHLFATVAGLLVSNYVARLL